MQRERKIVSGPLMEVDFQPVFENGKNMPTRPHGVKRSTEQQERYNYNKSVKKIVRLVNANFTNTDYLMHPTYEQDFAPTSEQQARADMRKFLQKVKRRRISELKKANKELLEAEKAIIISPKNKFIKKSIEKLENVISKLSQNFKYIYSIETVIYKRGAKAGQVNFHFHLFITGGLDRSLMEQLWGNGVRTNCNQFQPEKFGAESAAKYLIKDSAGSKRFVCSKNLSKPKELKPKDNKITAYGVEKLCKQRVDDAHYWEKRYKGYRFVRTYPRYNPYNGYWYLTVIMYKTNGSPPIWNTDNWCYLEK